MFRVNPEFPLTDGYRANFKRYDVPQGNTVVEIDRGLVLLIKLVVRSVARDVESWLALILATAILAAIMTLDIGLIVVGSHGSSADEQAFSVFGGVAICFSALVGLISLMMVIRVCLGLQRRSVALWQLAGVLPRTAFIALIAEVLLVSALSAALGALAAWTLWFPFTRMVLSSGLPPSDALDGTMPTAALWIGTMATAAVCVLGGVMASRRLARQDVLTALHAEERNGSSTRTLAKRIIRIVWIVALLAGIATLYWAISCVPPLSPGEATANFLTTYVGMGMLLCFALSQCAIPLVRGLLGIFSIGARRANTSWFLAINEASANIALTRSLVVPIALAGAAAGVVMTWLGKLVVVLGGSGGHVSAPLAQLLLLFGGAVVAGCSAAASVVFATLGTRSRDSAVLLASGGTHDMLRLKACCETVIYLLVSLVLAYAVTWLNELATDWALRAGPIPRATLTAPDWHAGVVVLFGIALVGMLLAIITAQVTRRQIIDVIHDD